MDLLRYRPKERRGWVRNRKGERVPVKVTVDDSGHVQQVELGDRLDATVRPDAVALNVGGADCEVERRPAPDHDRDPDEPVHLWTPLEGTR